MPLSTSLLSMPELWLGLIVTLAIIQAISSHYYNGLRKYNGPFLASLSDLWRLCHAYRNNNREPMIHMHDKYGDVVRMGPKVLSFAQPQAINDIYGPGKHFKKSDYYPVNAAVGNGVIAHTLFSNPDQKWHNQLRRSIGSNFTPNAVLKYETHVDRTIEVFLRELGERFADRPGEQGSIDWHRWLLYFAFDVIGDMTYSARHGFLEQGKDMYGIIQYVVDFLSYGFLAGQMPSIDIFLRHNPVLMWLERRGVIRGNTFPGVPFALKHLRQRQAGSPSDTEKQSNDQEDLLDRFLIAKKDRPDFVTDREVLGLSLSMMIAGSETTAITLTAFFYHLLQSPVCYDKLQREIDDRYPPQEANAFLEGIRFQDARSLRYLYACIQETFRMHPAFGFNFERIVPPSGSRICGEFIPGGTIVGCNAWVVQRNKDVYGEDADIYRPERWLAEPERVKKMEKTMFQFGAGDHICLGKNVSIMEMYKLVPALMRSFEISLSDPAKKWTLINGATVRMSGVEVRLRKRQN